MKNTIYPCIWFNGNADEAVHFYGHAFGNTDIKEKTNVTTIFEIEGFRIMALNGGPIFRPNPTMSIYTICETEDEIITIWNKLVKKGKVLMPLEAYSWSPKYGWVEDKFGVSWQLTLGKVSDMGQKLAPCLMFTGNQFGKAEEAMGLYTTIFKDSEINLLSRYEKRGKLQNGKISHGQFSLSGQRFAAIDSQFSHGFNLSEGNSLVVNCDTQAEIDYYWSALTDGGTEGRCGWLKDKFGFSWQVIPSMMVEWMRDSEKARRVTEAFMQMEKLDIEVLRNA